jgi:branched-chain amino acid aminotransferase
MLYNQRTIIFLDGKFIHASEARFSVYSQSLHYGNAAIEGLRAYQTDEGVRIFKAKEHFDRLRYSAQKLLINFDYTAEQLEKAAYELLKLNHLQNAYIRPLVFMEDSMGLFPVEKVHFFMGAFKWTNYHGHTYLDVQISPYERPHPKSFPFDAKISGSYVNSILATTHAKKSGYDEAILLDHEGYVAQGSVTNIFYEKDGELFTPPKGTIMPGITRQTIIDLAQEMGIRVHEEFFKPDVLKNADAAFFTGTATELVGIRSIDRMVLKMKPERALLNRLSDAYNNLLRSSNLVTESLDVTVI